MSKMDRRDFIKTTALVGAAAGIIKQTSNWNYWYWV